MKLAALCSGGKDSAYALWLAKKRGHDVEKILVMIPEKENSWMYHKPHPKLVELLPKAYGIPMKTGKSKSQKENETQDLKNLLENIRVDGIVAGAVESKYQRTRIESVCKELGLKPIFPLWKKKGLKLLRDMINSHFEIIITSVAARGLDRNWLGKKIDERCINQLKQLNEKYGIHIAGEGGEYETLALDGPFFEKKIIPIESEKKWMIDRGSLKIKKFNLLDRS